MRAVKSLMAVALFKRVIGYKPPTDKLPDTFTSSNDSLPEEYGEMKYGMPSRLTLDPEDNREAASMKGI
jgi:hypothetical protein